jgi:hypothetical protein
MSIRFHVWQKGQRSVALRDVPELLAARFVDSDAFGSVAFVVISSLPPVPVT